MLIGLSTALLLGQNVTINPRFYNSCQCHCVGAVGVVCMVLLCTYLCHVYLSWLTVSLLVVAGLTSRCYVALSSMLYGHWSRHSVMLVVDAVMMSMLDDQGIYRPSTSINSQPH